MENSVKMLQQNSDVLLEQNSELHSHRSWFSPRAWVPRFPPQCWLKTSIQALEQAEKKILSGNAYSLLTFIIGVMYYQSYDN